MSQDVPSSAAITSPTGETVPLVSVRNLRVSFSGATAVDGLSLDLAAGECLALIGESGSGKSVTGRSLLGLSGGRVTADRLSVGGEDLLSLGERALRTRRGSLIASIPQEALAGLDPLRLVGAEIDTALRLHTRLSAPERAVRAHELLRRAGITDTTRILNARPGALSGGLRQRALIAQALAGNPRVLVADEPTTALDASVRRGILELLGELRTEGLAVLLISHDLSSVRHIADTVAVMERGRIVEAGSAISVLDRPRSESARALRAALPGGVPRGQRLRSGATSAPPLLDAPPVLELHGVSHRFGSVIAAHEVSLSVHAGRTLGLLGSSGSGKSTLARIALGLTTADAGTVHHLGERPGQTRPRNASPAAHPAIGYVTQDPLSSFDPRLSVGQLLAEALSDGATLRISAVHEAAIAALADVGLPPSVLPLSPLALSGGQRQRVAIARALAGDPRVLVCDEPVSALDATVQAQVLDLLDDLQEQRGLGILLISHDLEVIRHMSDEVAVLDAGVVVEQGPTEQVFDSPQARLTRSLLAAGSGPAEQPGPTSPPATSAKLGSI